MTHKFGICLPKTVAEALEIDKVTDTDFRRKAVNKEMAKVKIAWKTNNGLMPQQARGVRASKLIGFQEIGCHIILFDISQDGLYKRKGSLCRWGGEVIRPRNRVRC
jgi:hypothetical protein